MNNTEPLTQDPPAPLTNGFSLNPERFKTSTSTLFIDRFMTHFIKVGGISIIAAVSGIFLFIGWQIWPLFQGARVSPSKVIELGAGNFTALGTDEWSEAPFVVDEKGGLYFVDASGKQGVQKAPAPFAETKNFTTFRYKPLQQTVIYGTQDGYFSTVKIEYGANYEEAARRIQYELKADPMMALLPARGAVQDIDYGDSGNEKLVAALVKEETGTIRTVALRFTQERTLFGSGKPVAAGNYDLTSALGAAQPKKILVDSHAESILVAAADGQVYYFYVSGKKMELRQVFRPFQGESHKDIASMDFIFGDVSASFTNSKGKHVIYSLFLPEGGEKRLFGRTKEFPALPKGADYFSPSLRNKAFIIGARSVASLRFLTTEEVRWEEKLPFEAKDAVISGKYNKIIFLDTANKLHFYDLHDPHPEASFKAFFGKLWYEGSPAPKYEWQSTGGSDEFEPKFSLIPLIIGTLKGTLYAMFFAVPIALIAAIYTSQFLEPKLKAIVKPTMEIMASLPSVVLGFLAALWLAPLIETRVPSILLMVIFIPLTAFFMGFVFNSFPPELKRHIRPGYEFLFFMPVFLAALGLCWAAGPWVEKIFFIATDPATGRKVADFRLWWPQVTGASFEQRNSLAVGFMMGFAVIPIIFTITEDSLSNVPYYLRAGSLALGASRWQTALYVILPTASAGIFSALMIGLGRAIGETMIVVMATGNTPIMDFNIFSGMRTLSANIAVELPEAPHHGSLYRTLFLGAMALFMATFFVNTVAEILRQRLREKYKTV